MPKPKRPHVTPSITIGGSAEKREWKEISVAEVHPGDTVPDVGVVESIGRSTRDGVVTGHTLINTAGESFKFKPGYRVLAFRLVGGDWLSVPWQDLRPLDRTQEYGVVHEMSEVAHGMYYKFDHGSVYIANSDTSKVFAFVRSDG
jgi:hypothetical protein